MANLSNRKSLPPLAILCNEYGSLGASKRLEEAQKDKRFAANIAALAKRPCSDLGGYSDDEKDASTKPALMT